MCALWGLVLGLRALRPAARGFSLVAAATAQLAAWSLLLAEQRVTVVEAYTVTGESDGILRVRASDTGHFERVLGAIRNHPGVTRTRSSLVLSRL